MFYENYASGSDRNYTGYCNSQIDALTDRQSMEPNPEKPRKLVWPKSVQRGGCRTAAFPEGERGYSPSV
jgi:hypothetical protein